MHMLSAQPPAISYFFSPVLPMVFFIQKQLLTGFWHGQELFVLI